MLARALLLMNLLAVTAWAAPSKNAEIGAYPSVNMIHLQEVKVHPDDQLDKSLRPEVHFCRVKLESATPAYDLAASPCRRSMKLAAQYYAIAQSDYSPTIGEICQAGYFPFDLFDSKTEAMHVGSSPGGKLLIDFDINSVGSPRWMLKAKRSVLNEFYLEVYHRQSPGNQIDPAQWKRSPSFWTGDNTVMLSESQMNQRLPTPGIAVTNGQEASFPYLASPQSQESSEDLCCWLCYSTDEVPAGETRCETWRAVCPTGGSAECEICWKFEECDTTIWRFWFVVQACGDPPDDVYTQLPCSFSGSVCDRVSKPSINCHAIVWTDPDPCPPPPTCPVAVEENFNKSQFINHLQGNYIYANMDCHTCPCDD